MCTPEKPLPTLREIRDSVPMSQAILAERLRAELCETKRTPESVLQIERRGTRDYYIIRALAHIFGYSHDEMAAITCPDRSLT